jgi:predicted nucleic acid-binding Zn ribbon protein
MPWEPLPDRREPDPAPMRAGLDRLVRHLGGPSAESMTSLFDRWSEYVGDTMSAHCRPVSLQAGVLTVAVDDPAWATEVRFLAPALRVRLNAELQDDAIASIEVRVRPRTGGNA